jgi:hypothetical protein
LVVPAGRLGNTFEAATAVAHPPGGTFHCREIPPDYTKVEVLTVKAEYKNWKIDIPTDEGLSLLGQCEGQFILWYKKDIVLDDAAQAADKTLQRLDALLEEITDPEEVLALPGPPQSLAHAEDPPLAEPPQSPRHAQDPPALPEPAQPTQDHHTEVATSPEHHQQQAPAPQSEAREKVPVHVRWFQKVDSKSVNQWLDARKGQLMKEAQHDQRAVTSPLNAPKIRRYPNVDAIKDTPDCPKSYVRGKHFLPIRSLPHFPKGMQIFHERYLHACKTDVNCIQARYPEYSFGSASGILVFDFEDIHLMFRLGYLETNLIRLWAL